MKKYLPLTCLSPWRHYTTLIDTAVKVTRDLGINKNFQWGLHHTISP